MSAGVYVFSSLRVMEPRVRDCRPVDTHMAGRKRSRDFPHVSYKMKFNRYIGNITNVVTQRFHHR